jgi:predicted dehydrogenase
MIKIGIIGAENSHAAAISKTINVEKKIKGCKVTAIWGEQKKFAVRTAEAGQIPLIVKKPEDMLGSVDAVIVDHRHGKYHLPAVKPFLAEKIPMFIDKPFCYRLSEGKRFLGEAKKKRVPVCSFSVLPKHQSFKDLKKELKKIGAIRAVVTTGPCDIKSKYGGIFFYGIHQVGLILQAVGFNVTHAQLNKGKVNSTATLFYDSGLVATMNLIKEKGAGFHFSAVGEQGRVDKLIVSDKNPYLAGIREFTTMFKTGRSKSTRESMLGPVAVLEALEKSLKEKKRIKVKSVF